MCSDIPDNIILLTVDQKGKYAAERFIALFERVLENMRLNWIVNCFYQGFGKTLGKLNFEHSKAF